MDYRLIRWTAKPRLVFLIRIEFSFVVRSWPGFEQPPDLGDTTEVEVESLKDGGTPVR